VVVFNSLSWLRDGLVAVGGVDVPRAAAVVDARGRRAPVQQAPDGSLLFRAEAVPPMGHAVYHLVEERSEDAPNPLKAAPNRLENERLRVRIDKHGRITSLFDKEARRECLPKGGRGNVLQFFDDRPHLHDAWDIDHNFEAIQWEAGRAESIEVIEQGPLRARVRVLWASATYTIRQDITLAAGSRRVDFDTRVDWHEKRTLLKVAFPVDIRAQKATYEIQYGAIERPTHRNAPHDRGQFEVPAQRWADLSEGDYGVSLLNDCKYGYDVQGNVLRLSLLRAPIDPDPHADEGHHAFTYAIYPHAGDWREGTVREAWELNAPLFPQVAPARAGDRPGAASLVTIDREDVIVDTVKRAEDSEALIVRLYEACGHRGQATLTFDRQPASVDECDLMEENDRPVTCTGSTLRIRVRPYELRTFKVTF
jgi:alpha-mannosidase